jgi:demethylmenaquinone methyltransferase/2-methoxy-6-polyprenyl-1,4-benzoquinol methylase
MNRDETVKYYQMRALEYDNVYTRDNPGRQEELAELYALSGDTLKGHHVLDIACGTGYWTRIISEQAVSIVGTDINPATLAEAEKKEYKCPVRFVQADVFDLPFTNNEFDGLLTSFILSHIKRQDLECLAQGIAHVIKPGSPVFLCDNNLICEQKPDLIWDNEHINSYKKRRLEDGSEYRILKNYFDREEISEIISPWGRIEKLNFGTYYWSVVLTMQ